jgi:hypothetical protein
MYVSC